MTPAPVLNYASDRTRDPLWLRALRVAASLTALAFFSRIIIGRGHGAIRIWQLMWLTAGRWEYDEWLLAFAVLAIIAGMPFTRSAILAGVGHGGTALLLTAWVELAGPRYGIWWNLPHQVLFLAALGASTVLSFMACAIKGHLLIAKPWTDPVFRRMAIAFLVSWLGLWGLALLLFDH